MVTRLILYILQSSIFRILPFHNLINKEQDILIVHVRLGNR